MINTKPFLLLTNCVVASLGDPDQRNLSVSFRSCWSWFTMIWNYYDSELCWENLLWFLKTFHVVSIKNILFSRFSSIVTINIDSTWQTLLSTGDYQRTLQVNVYYLFTITRGSRGGDGSGEFVDLHLVFDSLSEQVLDMILLFFRELITPALLVHYFIWNTKFLLIK